MTRILVLVRVIFRKSSPSSETFSPMRPGRAPGSPENCLPFEGVVERLWLEWNETSLFRLTLMKGTPLPSSQK